MKPQPQHEDEHLELDHLREELHCLERRVAVLENAAVEHPIEQPTQAVPVLGGLPLGADYTLPAAPNAIPAAGRAVLGLAGAFLLRALAESGSVPSVLVVVVAILYASTWLVFSVRTRQQDTFGSSIYGITAVLILAPLLWEATLRFNVLGPMATAGILIGFLVLSSALAWSRTSGAVITVTTLATAGTALALMVQTGNLVPFAAAILAIACVIEASACRGHARNMRAPVAVAADFAIWLIYFVMTRPSGVPEHYKPVSVAACAALGTLLVVIYGVSLVWQAVVIGRSLAMAEVVQATIAFTLAAGGTLAITQGRSAYSVGAVCAIACTACYFTAFVRFADSERRNHHVFASWGLALGLVACALIFPAAELTPIWSVAAVITMFAGARLSQPTLSLHGAVYLFAAGLISGLPAIILNAFTGERLEPATSVLWIMALSACCCYAACLFAKSGPVKVNVVPALLAAISIGALLILVVIPLIVGNPTPSFLATARTLIICTLAMAFGFTGSWTGHRELVWVCYVAIALGTVKLVMEDFRQGHPAALAVSLVSYGAVLILAPKLSSMSRVYRRG